MKKSEFKDKVKYWGKNLIALRKWKPTDMVKSDISLREEFDNDKHVSAMQ